MKHFLKVMEGIDVNAINAELTANPELWDSIKWRKELPKGPHSRMSDIWVRYNDLKNLGPDFNKEHTPVWYPAYEKLPSLKHIIDALMGAVDGKRLGGVLITRIPDGEGIAVHRDAGWHVETFDKFYVSVKSAPGAKFICHDEPREELEPQPGECWRFDNRKLHSVENKSGRDRITLIVCIETEKYKYVVDHGLVVFYEDAHALAA